MRLVHGGHIVHELNNADGCAPVAPSAIVAKEIIKVKDGRHLPASEPKELNTSEVKQLFRLYIKSTQRVFDAGFDGVEIHGAQGYLAEQFLHPHKNRRNDKYGGNVANRSRFLLEIIAGVVDAIGNKRTGVWLSPYLKISDLPP